MMQDQEARDIVLKRLYDIREADRAAELDDFSGTGLAPDTVTRMLEQLAQQGLIEWDPYPGGINSTTKYRALRARINFYGSHVIEGKATSPFPININVVHGSQGVRIGDGDNVQNVTIDRLSNLVNSPGATVQEKKKNGFLHAAFAFVQKAIRWLITGTTGSQ